MPWRLIWKRQCLSTPRRISRVPAVPAYVCSPIAEGSVRSHHDEVYPLFVGEGQNAVCGHAFAGHIFRFNSIIRMTFHKRAQLFLPASEQACTEFVVVVRRRRKGCRWVSLQLDYMLYEQLRFAMLSQRRRVVVGTNRESREIDRAENAFDSDSLHGLSTSIGWLVRYETVRLRQDERRLREQDAESAACHSS